MELVDMQGLKPCPLQGPGSSPGAGIISSYLSSVSVKIFDYLFLSVCLLKYFRL